MSRGRHSDGLPLDPNAQPRDLPSRSALWFLAATFLVAWALVAALLAFPETFLRQFGEVSGSHPLFLIAAFAPVVSAVTLVWVHCGYSGVGAFLNRVLIWRMSQPWALFVLFGVPLVFIFGSLIRGGWDFVLDPRLGVVGTIAVFAVTIFYARFEWVSGSHFWAVYAMLAVPMTLLFGAALEGQAIFLASSDDGGDVFLLAILLMLLLGPVEEFGWRGLLQPILQRHLAPLWAGVLVGAIWAIWHFPAFFLVGVADSIGEFLPFFAGSVAISVIMTPMLNASSGSLLWPMLFHWQLVNPLWPDARPYDSAALVCVAVVIVWWNRGELLDAKEGVKSVVPAPS